DPGPAEDPAPEAPGVRAGNPDLAPGTQKAAHLGQHGYRVRGVLQDVGQHHHRVRLRWAKLLQGPGIYREAPPPGQGRGLLVDLQPLHDKTVGGIKAQAPAFVAAQVQEAAGAPALVKGRVAIPSQPEAVPAGGQEPLPHRLISARHPGVVKSLVQALQFLRRGPGPGLLQAAAGAPHNVVSAGSAETVVAETGYQHLGLMVTNQAWSAGYLTQHLNISFLLPEKLVVFFL